METLVPIPRRGLIARCLRQGLSRPAGFNEHVVVTVYDDDSELAEQLQHTQDRAYLEDSWFDDLHQEDYFCEMASAMTYQAVTNILQTLPGKLLDKYI